MTDVTKPEVNIPEGTQLRNDSDNESSHALEVVFDPDTKQRRKASLVGIPSMRPPNARKTSCFVHTLLENQQTEELHPSVHGVAAAHKVDKLGAPPSPESNDLDKNSIAARSLTKSSMHDPATQSRLLTKEQLSDMAFGIRELAKRLAHFRLKIPYVKNVFLLTKAHDQSLVKLTRQLAEWMLKRDKKFTVWVENTLEHHRHFDKQSLISQDVSFETRLKFWTEQFVRQHPLSFDIVLSLGGDGTVLYASWLFQRIVPPTLSFAMGSLGFLTKFDFDAYQTTLPRVFGEDGITISLRLRFEATVMRSLREDDEVDGDLVEELLGEESEDHYTHRPDGTHNILNELVVDRGPNPTMSSIEVFGDNEHFTTVQADGICVATPTGSTAYNLAAGGSLSHPDNPVILVTAICAHTLSFRPIILPDTIVLRIGVPYDARTSSWASFDGRDRVELRPGDYVTISASRFPFPSVLPLDRRGEDWIDSIRRTLNWNSRQTQKAFDEAKEGKGEKAEKDAS